MTLSVKQLHRKNLYSHECRHLIVTLFTLDSFKAHTTEIRKYPEVHMHPTPFLRWGQLSGTYCPIDEIENVD